MRDWPQAARSDFFWDIAGMEGRRTNSFGRDGKAVPAATSLFACASLVTWRLRLRAQISRSL